MNHSETFQKVLDNIDGLKHGLCRLIQDLYFDQILSYEEKIFIEDQLNLELLKQNKIPSFDFLWRVGLKEPRIKWLIDQIEKYNLNETE